MTEGNLSRYVSSLAIIMLITLLLAGCFPSRVTASSAAEQPGDSLLQFTAAGHVLGFAPGSMIAASSGRMLRMDFIGSKTVRPLAENAPASYGGQPQAVPLNRVAYRDLWDGVTLVYSAAPGAIMESTYYLNSAGDAGNIRLRYNRPLSLDGPGNLVISFANGYMRESAPLAWQEIDGVQKPVEASFVIHENNELGFTLGNCAPGVPVVIDPALSWNTFLGSGSTDVCTAVAVDYDGNVYVSGYSSATWGSPVRAYTGDSDAFAVKLNSYGALQWSTFLGGSGADYGQSIAVDSSGKVYVGGTSGATWGAPVIAYAGSTDAFIARLDSQGILSWNTFLGSSSLDEGLNIVIDGSGNTYLTGTSAATWGTPKRGFTGGTDALVASVNSTGALNWNTFLGGSGSDTGNGICRDLNGNIYIAGSSDAAWGNAVRAYTAGNDAFAVRLDGSGNFVWNTFLGGGGTDFGRGIAYGSGNLYVVGESAATWGAPVRAYTASTDAFVAMLNNSGALSWNTFLGGSDTDRCANIDVDDSYRVYVAGYSKISWGSPERAFTANEDAFAAGLNGSSGALSWNTFLGGGGNDQGNSIVVDETESVYVCGESGSAWGSPVRGFSVANDGFAARLDKPMTISGYVFTTLGNVNFYINAGNLGSLSWMPAGDIRCSSPANYNFTYGMFSLSITNLRANQQSAVTIKFPNPLPLSVRFYRCTDGTLNDITARVTRVDEYTYIITQTGNGSILVGPGFTQSAPPSSSATMPSSGSQGASSTLTVKTAALSTRSVAPGTPVTVTATVANPGQSNSTSQVKLYVNDKEESTQQVTVVSGGSATVTFNVLRNQTGVYSVTVDGVDAGSFTVSNSTQTVILFVIGAFALLLLFFTIKFFIRKRRGDY